MVRGWILAAAATTPWIGPGYDAGGLCVVALNIKHTGEWWSLNVEYAIAGQQIDGLTAGRRRIHRSTFAYRSMAASLATLASLDATEPSSNPAPQDVAVALRRIVRLQAAKCSPLPQRDNGPPTAEMRQHCPPRYLAKELAILRPSVILTLGAAACSSVEGASTDLRVREQRGSFRRATMRVADRDVVLLAMPHPAAHGRTWPEAYAELLTSLRAAPLGR